MKKAVTGCAAFLFATPACAADVAVKPMLDTPPPVLNWTGWYAGVNAGYGWTNGGRDISAADPINIGMASFISQNGPAFPDLKPGSFIGGGQIGYDWQNLITSIPNLVAGVVADFQGADIAASGRATVTPPELVSATLSLSEKLNFLGTVRGRVGVAFDNWLLYGSAGIAYGKAQTSLNFSSPRFMNGEGAFFTGSTSETNVGWAAGAGINYALTRNWVLGIDYLHYDLGRTSVTAAMTAPGRIIPDTTITASQSVAGDIVRAVVNYRF